MKILEDTFAIQQPTWCWRPSWSTGQDSAFGLLMKFALLNAMTAKEIATEFVSRTCGKRTALLRTVNVDLRAHQVFDLPRLAKALQTDIDIVAEGFLSTHFADLSPAATELKWCEQCMAWGLHLPVTQMRTVTQCPIHNRPLLRRCAQCDAAIPYTLNPASFDNPFSCPGCQLDLAPRLRYARAWVPELRTEHITRISILRKYATGYSRLTTGSQPVPTLTGHCAGLRLPGGEEQRGPGYFDFVGQVVAEIASEQGQKSLPLASLSTARYGMPRSTPEPVIEHFGRAEKDPCFQTAEEMLVVRRVYLAIKRRLWRQLGAHRGCVTSACRHFWWDMRGAKTACFCATATAFIRWRMLWEGRSTPRYLDSRKPGDYFGILGWLQARPAPYPDDWPVERKEWMLAHIFEGVCLASYESLAQEAEAATVTESAMTWDAKATTPHAATHWVLADSDVGETRPIIFTPSSGLLRRGQPHRPGSDHRLWHTRQLAAIAP